MKLKKITLMTVFSLLLFESDASLARWTSRAELSQLPQRVDTLQTQVTTLQTQQNMLRDYSTIPDDLYDGVTGVAGGGLGAQLKVFLNSNIASTGWATTIPNLASRITATPHAFTNDNDFYTYVLVPLDTFNRSTASLQEYLEYLAGLLNYMNGDIGARLGGTREIVQKFIIDMLLYHPSGS